MARLCVLTWIEQPMEVNDEIAHVGVVNARLRLRLPGRVSGGVVREHADDFHPVEVLESRAIEIGQLAPEDEVKQLLLGAICHDSPFLDAVPGSQICGNGVQGNGRFRKCSTMRACRSRPAATSTPCATSRRL